MVKFINSHKVVAWKITFLELANVQKNKNGHEDRKCMLWGLKWLFSQVEGDLDLQKILKLAPFLNKKWTREKMVLIAKKKEDEESKKAKNLAKEWSIKSNCTKRRNWIWICQPPPPRLNISYQHLIVFFEVYFSFETWNPSCDYIDNYFEKNLKS
jgi:hypothetical protein